MLNNIKWKDYKITISKQKQYRMRLQVFSKGSKHIN